MSRTSRTFAAPFMRVSYRVYIRAWFGTEFVQLNLRYKNIYDNKIFKQLIH